MCHFYVHFIFADNWTEGSILSSGVLLNFFRAKPGTPHNDQNLLCGISY